MPESPISRRRFLQGSAIAAALPLVMARRAFAAPPAEPLHVGLIGCGGRGTGAAMQALAADSGAVLYAMADALADHLDSSYAHLERAYSGENSARLQVPAERRFVGFDAYQRLIDSDVDVVLLATPPYFRPQHLEAAINAGKHVFTEKPMAVDAPGVRQVMAIAKIAREKSLNLVSGFCWRYNVRHRAFFPRIKAGAIGKVQAVYSTYNASPLETCARQPSHTDMEFQLRNWKHFNWLGGDHITEQAVHSLDKMSWAFGDQPPLSATAIGGRQARTGEASGNIYDHFSVTYDYPEGARGFHMCRQIAGCSNDNSDYLYGTGGKASITGWGGALVIEGEEPWEFEGDGNDMYQQEHDELFAAIRKGEPINDGEWMTTSTMLAILGRMAAYTGRTLTYAEALGSTERLGPDTCSWSSLVPDPIPIPGQTKFI